MQRTRRSLLQGAVSATLGSLATRHTHADDAGFPPVRAITRGPKHHWFGYYDKLQFDPTGRYVLGMEVDFEHRSPQADDVIKIGMVDLHDGDRWIELGQSTAWCWQQGCMLQWLPGSKSKILWNDRQDDRFVCHILMLRPKRIAPFRIRFIASVPDGRTAVSPDFRRINDVRPGYGYAGLADPFADDLAPTEVRHFSRGFDIRRNETDHLAGRHCASRRDSRTSNSASSTTSIICCSTRTAHDSSPCIAGDTRMAPV